VPLSPLPKVTVSPCDLQQQFFGWTFWDLFEDELYQVLSVFHDNVNSEKHLHSFALLLTQLCVPENWASYLAEEPCLKARAEVRTHSNPLLSHLLHFSVFWSPATTISCRISNPWVRVPGSGIRTFEMLAWNDQSRLVWVLKRRRVPYFCTRNMVS